MAQRIFGAGSAGPTSITSGQRISISSINAMHLTTDHVPCCFVWLGAPPDGSNTDTVMVGGSSSTSTGIPIVPGNYEGVTISINDAYSIFVKSVNGSQKLNYVILA